MAIDFDALYKQDSVDKQMRIEFDGGIITNTELHSQEFELNESLCSESQLRFGCCEASSIKFRISNVFTSLKSKCLSVSQTLAGNTAEPFVFGKYKVNSDSPTADRRFRNVVAYDSMYDIINVDAAAWYNTIFPGDNTRVTLKEFRDSFFAFVGIEQETVTLPNDAIYIAKTVDPTQISGKYIVTAICEMNGCFGHIGRNGKFQYIFLKAMEEVTGSGQEVLGTNTTTIDKSIYFSNGTQYEDFIVNKIDALRIRQNDSDEGYVYGDGDNCYTIEDNLLLYGYSESELEVIAGNIFPHISGVWYRPANVRAKGNPTLSVGDGIKLDTKYTTIYTYILERTLRGIQALTDEYSAQGTEYCEEQLNSINKTVLQLKGMINQVDNSAFHFNVVRNGKAVEIGDGKNRRVIRADIMTGQDAQIKVEIQINLDLIIATGQEKAVCTVTYALGGNLLDTTPVETWSESGKHILSLMYFMNISDSGFHTFDLFLSMSGGSVAIAALDALEIFTGTNLVENPGWSGQLELVDDAPVFELEELEFDITAYSERVSTSIIIPDQIILTDAAPVFELEELEFDGSDYVDGVSFKPYISELLWREAAASTWGTLKEIYVWGHTGG